MPAFMAGMGMRGGLPKRQQQFNIQQPQQNQWTNQLNDLSRSVGELTKQQNTPATTSATQTTTNPYMAAATGGGGQPNPWTYNAQTGQYTPNSAGYTPEWMAPKAPAATAPMITQRQVKDFTKRGEGESGTLKQAYDLLQQEGAKRGKSIPDLAKYGSQMGPGGMVSGKLYNQVMEDIFGEDTQVADPNWKAPITPAPNQPAQSPWMPPNPNLGLGGIPGRLNTQELMGGMGNNAPYMPHMSPSPEEEAARKEAMRAAWSPEERAQADAYAAEKQSKLSDIYKQMGNITSGARVRPEPTYWK